MKITLNVGKIKLYANCTHDGNVEKVQEKYNEMIAKGECKNEEVKN